MTTSSGLEFRARPGPAGNGEAERLHSLAEADFGRYEVPKYLVDEYIDLRLNYPGAATHGVALDDPHVALPQPLGPNEVGHPSAWLRFSDRFPRRHTEQGKERRPRALDPDLPA